MNSPDPDKTNKETLEYLLGIVVENREQRCSEIRDSARSQANEILKQAHTRVRSRVHHHIVMLREKYLQRISAAQSRNQTLIRQQRQLADKEVLDTAWPLLREALRALWNDSASRDRWLDAAITSASSSFLQDDWQIEHPVDFNVEDQQRLKHYLTNIDNRSAELSASDDIEAGIRITVNGTVMDATIEGLLQQKRVLEARLIARMKRELAGHD